MALKISWKADFFVVSTVIIISLILTVINIYSDRATLEQDVLRNSIIFSEISSPSIYGLYLTYYTHPTETEFNTFKTLYTGIAGGNSDLISMMLIGSSNGKVLFDSNEFKLGKYTGSDRYVSGELLNEIKLESTVSRRISMPSDGNALEVVVPIKETFGGHIVSAVYVFSYARIDQTILGGIYRSILITIVLSALVILAAGIFARRLVKPISRMTSLIDEITKGNMDVELESSIKERQDEIGELGRAFDRILVSLKLAVKKVGLTKEELQLGTLVKEKQEAEKRAKEASEFVSEIIDHAGIPVIAFTKGGTLLIANQKLLEITGYEKSQIDTFDKWINLAFPAKEPKLKMQRAFAEFYQGKKVEDFVIPIKCVRDTTCIVVGNMTPVKDSEGRLTGAAIFMRDLSEVFELENQIKHWAANGFVQLHRGETEETANKIKSSLNNIEISGNETNKKVKKKGGNKHVRKG